MVVLTKEKHPSMGGNSTKDNFAVVSPSKPSKRKRAHIHSDTAIKSKVSDNDEDNTHPSDTITNEIVEDVSAKRFKSHADDILLLDRLHSTNALSTLKDMQTKIELLKSDSTVSEDVMEQFFHEGGTARDILQALSQADKVKSADAATVFNACEAILLHLGAHLVPADIDHTDESDEKTSKTKKMQTLAVDLTREILQNHMRYVMILLSDSNTAQQAISSLRLLTAMVAAGGPIAAKEVLLKVDFEHPTLAGLSNRCSKTNNVSIRKCHLEFLLAFFVAGSTSVIKDFLEKPATRNHLGSLFPGFIYDECNVVQLVIGTLHEKLMNNLAVSKTAKMKLFSVHNLKYILALWVERS